MASELTHIGFIADGNRRWARERGLPTFEGHRKGFDKVEMIIDQLKGGEVKYVSFFVFSTENWDRSQDEINYLMKLLDNMIDRMVKKAQKENLRIVVCGRPEPVDPKLWAKICKAERDTQDATGLTICFCFNYGGRWEIVDAAKRAAEAGEVDWSPESFCKYLYHPEVPDLDMIVRTSGEERISGFQLWRAAYAEFCFLTKHFPAVEPEDVNEVIGEFHSRHRRFGK